MSGNGYAHPEVLVDTGWVANHLTDARYRFIEVDEDINVFRSGHIPNAIGWDWQVDIQDTLRRNIPDQQNLEALLSRSGITTDTVIILYGDRNNLFATYAFWVLKYYGHADVRIMDGGRKKWLAEGRPLTTTFLQPEPTTYSAKAPNKALRALRNFVLKRLAQRDVVFVDVRSAKEFSGELLAPEHLPREGALRGGHIPGAVNIPWGQCLQRDSTFKPAEVLQRLYRERQITPDKEVVVYCRIGERSSLTWFVLTYLLGYPTVRNYDGSWTEWGNLIDAPIERP